MTLKRGPRELVCSQRGCEEPAAWAITWSNPALPFGREKNWLACEDHRETLENYLGYRKFPQTTRPLQEYLAAQGDHGAGDAPRSTGVDLR